MTTNPATLYIKWIDGPAGEPGFWLATDFPTEGSVEYGIDNSPVSLIILINTGVSEMTQPFTTIRIYKNDKALLQKYGDTTHEAFRQVMRKNCPHPESKRMYVVADLPAVNEEALTEHGERRHAGGFFCRACETYFFPASENLPEAE